MSDIRIRYPNITKEEVDMITHEELNKMSIAFLELLVKDYKEMLQDIFKTGKSWKCSEENLEWLKNYLREQKNDAELHHKNIVQEQSNIRSGLNPTFCYKH